MPFHKYNYNLWNPRMKTCLQTLEQNLSTVSGSETFQKAYHKPIWHKLITLACSPVLCLALISLVISVLFVSVTKLWILNVLFEFCGSVSSGSDARFLFVCWFMDDPVLSLPDCILINTIDTDCDFWICHTAPMCCSWNHHTNLYHLLEIFIEAIL